jgi:V/A-type H+-transporting ATPase subunit E
MALDDIYRALEEQAESEIQDVQQDAQDRAEAILEDAKDEAERIRTQLTEEADRDTRSRASQSVNAVRLETKKKVAAVKQEAVADVFEKAKKKLAQSRTADGYDVLFRELAKESFAGVKADDVEVHVAEADVPLAEKTLSDMGVSAPVQGDSDIMGGLIVVMAEGRIMRRNTLEERLFKVEQMIQSDVAEILFS